MHEETRLFDFQWQAEIPVLRLEDLMDVAPVVALRSHMTGYGLRSLLRKGK